jgi:hypothetical protein
MTNVFGPQTQGVALVLPSGNAAVRYGSQNTWVKPCAPDGTGGTNIDAAFFNNLIGNLNYVVTSAGLTYVRRGDMSVLYRSIQKLIDDSSGSKLLVESTFGTTLGHIGN